MLRLFSGLCTLLGFLVLVSAALYFYRNPLAARLLEAAVERQTGLIWQAEGVEADVFGGVVTVTNLQLVNPGHFRERRCLVVPSARIELDLSQMEKGRLVASRVAIDVADLVIVRSSVRETNIERIYGLVLDPGEKRPGATATPLRPEFLVERLDLSAARVTAVDYTTGANPEPIVRDINLKDVTFPGIQNARDLQRAVFGTMLRAAQLDIPGIDVLRLAEIGPQPAAPGSAPPPPPRAAAGVPAMMPVLPKPVPQRAPAPAAPAADAIPDAPALPVPAR